MQPINISAGTATTKCTFEMLDTVFCNKYKEYLLNTKVSARGKVDDSAESVPYVAL